MDSVWIVLILYFICVCVTIPVSRADFYSEIVNLDKPGNISCSGESKVDINHVSVLQGDISLCEFHCNLNDEDLSAINKACQDSNSCRLDVNWTTSCLLEYGFINITYICKEAISYECNFENNSCNWEYSDWFFTFRDGVRPFANDHTTGKDYGHYIYISDAKKTENVKAMLTSGRFLSNETMCLTFWYQMTDTNLYLGVNQTGKTNTLMYKAPQDKTNGWLNAMVDFKSDEAFTIVIESQISRHGSNKAIALDDIDIFNGACSDNGKVYCNFETDNCSWNSTGTLRWEHKTAISSPSPENIDHTTRTGSGFYLRVNPYSIGGEARIVSATVISTKLSCVSVWYYIHGEPIESFNLYQNNTMVASMNISQKDAWYRYLKTISVSSPYSISFSANFTQYNDNSTDRCIIIDDVAITNGSCPCKKEVQFTHKCLDTNKSVKLECQAKELLNNSFEIMLQHQNLTYDPTECVPRKKVIEESITKFCWQRFFSNNQPCTFRPYDFLRDENMCFVVNDTKQLLVNFSCTDSTTVDTTKGSSSSSTTARGSTIKDSSIYRTTAGTTTDSSIYLTTAVITTDSSIYLTTAGLPDNAARSSDTSKTTGIIVGVLLGIGFIVSLVIFLWCFITRSKYLCKKSANHDNHILSNDYTGQQLVALPALPNQISNYDGYTEIHIKSDKYQHVNSHLNTSINTSGRKYAKLDQLKNLSDNKAAHSLHANGATNHDYIYLDETEVRSTQTSIHVPGVNMLKDEIHKSNEYAVIDPNSDHSSGITKNITLSAPSLGNYAILDPNETGFFRPKVNKETTTEYELAVPINDNECVSGLHDPYSVSENGTYDSTNMVRHNETETNIYNHAVENVYDTSSHERKIVDDEGTYDHFFGDETEDNYNITKRD